MCEKIRSEKSFDTYIYSNLTVKFHINSTAEIDMHLLLDIYENTSPQFAVSSCSSSG
jgi:hypothetical protein